MAKRKGPAALNSRVTRISLHTYMILKDMSEHTGLSIAEALDKLLWDTKTIPKVLTPAITAIPKLALSPMIAKPIPALSVHGDKHVAVAGMKPKGGKIHG